MGLALPKLLLHVCCGPCATHVIDVLREDYAVTLFFSNSNIAPYTEYQARLCSAEKLAVITGLDMVTDIYDHEAWLAHVRGLEGEPEKGRRCAKCFEYNLRRSAHYARRLGYEHFTTTLTISPHKDAATIFETGRALGEFLALDFKKGDGFRHSTELSKAYGLYRQQYCGCEFSIRA